MGRAWPHCKNELYPLWAVCLLTVMLAGCAPYSVKVAGDFPRPVMQPLPLRVGLYLDDELKHFTHEVDIPQGRDWMVDIGEANQALFRQLTAGMFIEAPAVSGTRVPAGMSLDAVLQPCIENFHFVTPMQADHPVYEATIVYRMRVFAPDGRLVTDWPVNAHGATPPDWIGGAEENLEAAIVEAMRDAAATVIAGFPEQPEVAAFLQTDEPRLAQDSKDAAQVSDAEIPSSP